MKTAKKNPAAQALGRLGGSRNSRAQNRARKQNAQKAGRPRRVCKKCNAPVIGGHVDRRLDQTCGEHGWRWERAGTKHPSPPSPLDAIAATLANTQLTDAAKLASIATIIKR